MSLEVKTIVTRPISENCYLVSDTATNVGMIIDPGNDADKILEAVRAGGLKIEAIVLTHGHWDHIGALEDVRAELNAKVYIHEADAKMLLENDYNLKVFFLRKYTVPIRPAEVLLKDGDSICVGNISFKVLHTPGHTPGGICLYSEVANLLFSGDSLFDLAIGRTDFEGGSYQDLVDSLKKKILTLPPKTIVYPGHGGVTTIGRECRQNPYVGNQG